MQTLSHTAPQEAFAMLRSPLPRQRGVALLVIVMLVLFIISIALFYLNRSLLFEQRLRPTNCAPRWRTRWRRRD